MMLNPNDSEKVQLEKQSKIINALANRMEHPGDLSGSPVSQFHSSIEMQIKNLEKSRDLDDALVNLRKLNSELEAMNAQQDGVESYLTELLETMQEGYALFSDEKLLIFNSRFKNLLPDVSKYIEAGIEFKEYIDLVAESCHLNFSEESDRIAWSELSWIQQGDNLSTFLLGLENDRWIQFTDRRTREGNIAILQTDVTDDVRLRRLENDRIIDEQAKILQAVFDHLNLGIGTFTAEGDLLVHNRQFAELIRLPENLLIKGTNIYTIFDYLQENNVFKEFVFSTITDSFFERIEELDSFQWEVERMDGQTMDLGIQRLPNGEFIASLMDITNEKKATDQLKKINETLEQRVQARTEDLTSANQLLQVQYDEAERSQQALHLAKEAAEKADISKTKFLAAASHDLLQPINAAKLYISKLADSEFDRASKDTVNRLDHSFTTIEILLRDLLDISRLDSAKKIVDIEEFPINKILDQLEVDFSQLARKKKLKLKIVNSKVWVRSDQHYLWRIIQNLVANALKFTPTGQVLVGCRRRNNLLVLEVWDTGIGISRKNRDLIFKEFTRLDHIDEDKGMGLGLSIVEHACRHLGHSIKLRSKVGVGSVFSIELPIVDTSANIFPESEQPVVDKSNKLDLIVMLVENDEDVLHATTQILEGWGASVLAVTSTNEALQQIDELGMPPDILLADYQLDGDDNGINTILQLREKFSNDIPAIMITASQSKLLSTSSRDHDFAILSKPVELSKLRSLIAWKTSGSMT